MEAFGNGYADPRNIVGRLLPEDEIIKPHECVPGICLTGDPETDGDLATDLRTPARHGS